MVGLKIKKGLFEIGQSRRTVFHLESKRKLNISKFALQFIGNLITINSLVQNNSFVYILTNTKKLSFFIQIVLEVRLINGSVVRLANIFLAKFALRRNVFVGFSLLSLLWSLSLHTLSSLIKHLVS